MDVALATNDEARADGAHDQQKGDLNQKEWGFKP
jgi:hypothetical protein